jgi:hypothetical protein
MIDFDRDYKIEKDERDEDNLLKLCDSDLSTSLKIMKKTPRSKITRDERLAI